MNEITLKVTLAEIDTIAKGLFELPFKIAQPLLEKLNQQVVAAQTLEAAKASEIEQQVV
jgi:hypothetical protein